MNRNDVEIFTDGACRGNPGPGGWAALLRQGSTEKLIKGSEPHTTNNRMELLAAIEGLCALKRASQVALTTDSQYVRQGITKWIAGWKKNGWQTAAKKPVKIRIFGCAWMRPWPNMMWFGIGLKVTVATLKMSARIKAPTTPLIKCWQLRAKL